MSDTGEPTPIHTDINPVAPLSSGERPPVAATSSVPPGLSTNGFYPNFAPPPGPGQEGSSVSELTPPTTPGLMDKLAAKLGMSATPPAPEPFVRPTIVPSPTLDMQTSQQVPAQAPESTVTPAPQEPTPSAPPTSPETPVIHDENIKELLNGREAKVVQLTSGQQVLALVGARDALGNINNLNYRGAVRIGDELYGVWEPKGGPGGDILIEIKSGDSNTKPPQPQG